MGDPLQDHVVESTGGENSAPKKELMQFENERQGSESDMVDEKPRSTSKMTEIPSSDPGALQGNQKAWQMLSEVDMGQGLTVRTDALTVPGVGCVIQVTNTKVGGGSIVSTLWVPDVKVVPEVQDNRLIGYRLVHKDDQDMSKPVGFGSNFTQ